MEIFRLLAKRSLRVGLIVALVGLIFGFGHFMTPRGPDAMARVFHDMGDTMSSPGMPEYMKLQVDEGAVQEVYLNDNTLYYTLNRTAKPVGTLLDYYETLYSNSSTDRDLEPAGARDALLKRIPAKDRSETVTKLDKTNEIVNDRFIRFEGDGWGGFATIVNGEEGDADWSNKMAGRIGEFQKTGEAKALGDPKVVVAFDDPSQGDTQYFNVWPADDFNHKNVRPKGNEDTPGFDVEDVQRPFGSQRMVTFGQQHGQVAYTIVVYRGGGDVDSVLEHFAHEMTNDGWALSARFAESQSRLEEPEPALLFAKDGREAYIGLREQPDSDEVTSTVVIYERG